MCQHLLSSSPLFGCLGLGFIEGSSDHSWARRLYASGGR